MGFILLSRGMVFAAESGSEIVCEFRPLEAKICRNPVSGAEVTELDMNNWPCPSGTEETGRRRVISEYIRIRHLDSGEVTTTWSSGASLLEAEQRGMNSSGPASVRLNSASHIQSYAFRSYRNLNMDQSCGTGRSAWEIFTAPSTERHKYVVLVNLSLQNTFQSEVVETSETSFTGPFTWLPHNGYESRSSTMRYPAVCRIHQI